MRRREHFDKGEVMVRLMTALVAGLSLALSGAAFAAKDCGELKSEIEAKIKKNGVDKFTLDIVDKDAQADGKVVGTCDSGAKKIVYKKG
jgi:predicted lipoprotein with Yx(FWY)xxD motif